MHQEDKERGTVVLGDLGGLPGQQRFWRRVVNKINFRVAMGFFFLLLILIVLQSGAGSLFTLDALKENRDALISHKAREPFQLSFVFILIYVLVTALSIPGATILTLAGGAVFGLVHGVVLVSIASTLGATLSFLAARHFFRDVFERRFRSQLAAINHGLQKEGLFYLFTLRLIPAVPFFLVNLAMGLTSFSAWKFAIISQIGMLPGTLVYVYAGTEIGKIESVEKILTPELAVSFALLGGLPWISKWSISAFRTRRNLFRYPKPARFDYNLIVIGGGSAGLVSSYLASALRAKVALIEKHKMGGDCLNSGCVPSKALLRAAKAVQAVRRAEEFGLKPLSPVVDFAKVMQRVHEVIAQIAPHDSVERYTRLGVDCIAGEARLLSPYEVQVNGKTLTAKNIVIATGARPVVPELPGLSEIRPLTSDNLWDLRELPKKLVVLGGGPVGCELAQAFSRLGSSVTLVERGSRLLSREDLDVSEHIAGCFKREGIQILSSHEAVRVEKSEVGSRLVCRSLEKEVSVSFDHLLIAVGRQANVKGFGLEELGVELSSHGTIVANGLMRTTKFPNIYACGDVTGPYQFTHVAAHQAQCAVMNALFSPLKSFAIDYRVIPWCTFTDPEVARVGLNEVEARELGLEYQISKYNLDDLDRAIAEGEAHGFVKVLTEPGRDRILGATIVGPRAGDIIGEYVTAMKYGLGLNKILNTIHIYPTFSEANKYAAGVWRKQNAPELGLRWLAKFHSLRRR